MTNLAAVVCLLCHTVLLSFSSDGQASDGQAAFLASVQVGFLVITRHPDCDATPTAHGCYGHTLIVLGMINFFSYLALAADVLAALSAVMVARSATIHCTHFIKEVKGRTQPLNWNILHKVVDFDRLRQQAEEVVTGCARVHQILDSHSTGETGVVLILTAITFFFVALVIHIVDGQPRFVWIPLLVSIGVMVIAALAVMWEGIKDLIPSNFRRN